MIARPYGSRRRAGQIGAGLAPTLQHRRGISRFSESDVVGHPVTDADIHYDLRFNTPDPATLPTDVWFLHSHNAVTTCSRPR